MTQERSHQPSGPLALAVGLAAIAGFVDAHVYLNVAPVFVANMSGNLIHLGMAAGLQDFRGAAASGVALLAFITGVALATLHHDRRVRLGASVRPDALLAVEAALVCALPVLIVVFDIEFGRPRPADYPIFVIGGIAMGIQAAALRRVGAIAVSTTYGTGAIVRIGEKVVLATRRAERADEHRRRVTIAVLAAIIISYVAGAVIAAAAGSSPALLLIPAAALVVAAIASRLTNTPEPDSTFADDTPPQ